MGLCVRLPLVRIHSWCGWSRGTTTGPIGEGHLGTERVCWEQCGTEELPEGCPGEGTVPAEPPCPFHGICTTGLGSKRPWAHWSHPKGEAGPRHCRVVALWWLCGGCDTEMTKDTRWSSWG